VANAGRRHHPTRSDRRAQPVHRDGKAVSRGLRSRAASTASTSRSSLIDYAVIGAVVNSPRASRTKRRLGRSSSSSDSTPTSHQALKRPRDERGRTDHVKPRHQFAPSFEEQSALSVITWTLAICVRCKLADGAPQRPARPHRARGITIRLAEDPPSAKRVGAGTADHSVLVGDELRARRRDGGDPHRTSRRSACTRAELAVVAGAQEETRRVDDGACRDWDVLCLRRRHRRTAFIWTGESLHLGSVIGDSLVRERSLGRFGAGNVRLHSETVGAVHAYIARSLWKGCAVLHVSQRLGDVVRVDSGDELLQLA
jgi:hypothetical protein